MDAKRIAWAAGDMLVRDVPLSRWDPRFKEEFAETCAPLSVAVGVPAAAEVVAKAVQAHSEQHPGWPYAKNDGSSTPFLQSGIVIKVGATTPTGTYSEIAPEKDGVGFMGTPADAGGRTSNGIAPS